VEHVVDVLHVLGSSGVDTMGSSVSKHRVGDSMRGFIMDVHLSETPSVARTSPELNVIELDRTDVILEGCFVEILERLDSALDDNVPVKDSDLSSGLDGAPLGLLAIYSTVVVILER
jgi:hypothetical protein